jgi:hypothetical protein
VRVQHIIAHQRGLPHIESLDLRERLYHPEPEAVSITREGVLARFWRSVLPKWIDERVVVNAGDVVYEGVIYALDPDRLVLIVGKPKGAMDAVQYEDIIGVERITKEER